MVPFTYVRIGGAPRLPVIEISQVGFTLQAMEVATSQDTEYRQFRPGALTFDQVRIGLSSGSYSPEQTDAVADMEAWWGQVQGGVASTRDVTVERPYFHRDGGREGGTVVILGDCLPVSYDPLGKVLTLKVARMELQELYLARGTLNSARVSAEIGYNLRIEGESEPFLAADASGGQTVLEFGDVPDATGAFSQTQIVGRSVAPLRFRVSPNERSHLLEAWIQAVLSMGDTGDLKRDIVLDVGGPNPIHDLLDAFPTRVIFFGPTLANGDGTSPVGVDLTVQAYRPR